MNFLTDQHVRDYERDGFVVIKGGFAPRTCDKMLNRIERLITTWDLEKLRAASKPFVTTDQSNRSSDEWFLTSGDDVRPFFEEEGETPTVNKIGHALHELDPLFRELVRSAKIKNALKCLGYRSPVPVQSMFIAKSAKVGGEISAHQDSTFLVSNPFSVCGIWIALKKATVENGCMFFVPGSHRTRPIDRLFLRDPTDLGCTIFEPPSPPIYDVQGAIPVEADVGDVVIFHGSVVHYSAPNRSNIPRPAYVMHFAEQSCEWHPRNWLQSRFFDPLFGGKFRLPLIDLRVVGKDADRLWDIYMSEYGFAIITGHDVPRKIIEDLRTSQKEFFARDEKSKLRYSVKGYGETGYNPFAKEAVSDDIKLADPIESYYMRCDRLKAPDDDVNQLFAAADKYRKALDEHVLIPILRLSARALGLEDEQALVNIHADYTSTLKMSHYPRCEGGRNVNRYGAHTDWEGFTILLPDEHDDDNNGLEVLLQSGEWISPGRVAKDAFIVNAGDFIPVWTKGRWHSPTHRVIVTDPNRSRFSIPYFTGPNAKTTVMPIVDGDFSSTDSRAFEPLSAGEWVTAKSARARL